MGDDSEPGFARLFAIGDTHFAHRKILAYTSRPFETVEAMDEALVAAWNEQVQDEDLVVHVGDFGFGPRSHLMAIAGRLRGRKVLVVGNHDRQTVSWWKRAGFVAYKTPVRYGPYLFSHAPLPTVPDGLLNVHGHLHDAQALDDGRHLCVSVEKTNFRPLLLGWVRPDLRFEPYTEG